MVVGTQAHTQNKHKRHTPVPNVHTHTGLRTHPLRNRGTDRRSHMQTGDSVCLTSSHPDSACVSVFLCVHLCLRCSCVCCVSVSVLFLSLHLYVNVCVSACVPTIPTMGNGGGRQSAPRYSKTGIHDTYINSPTEVRMLTVLHTQPETLISTPMYTHEFIHAFDKHL